MNSSPPASAVLTDNLTRIAALIFFIWAALMFTTPVGEGDFFWHVKTGEWIWQHFSLPDADPFSFTVKDINPFRPESKRIPFLLKQYWLGQLGFYGIWTWFGEAGMVIFRALCYSGILFFLYQWGRRLAGNSFWPLCGVILAGKVLQNYSNERPQIFAFIFMPLLLFLLETLRNCREARTPGIAGALILLMVLWSNCHGSYILGIVVIAIYAASQLILSLTGPVRLNRHSLSAMGAAALATGVNPNGFGAFREFFSLSSSYTNLVAEFKSPIDLAFRYGAIDWFYWLFLCAALAVLALRIRRMPLAQILVISSLAALSLSGTRYIPFFIMTAPLLCGNLPHWPSQKILKALPFVAILLLASTANYTNVLKFREERAFPLNAVKFLREKNIAGNMFNYIGWGGYLMCYSKHPVFIDGRTLVEELLPVHDRILFGVSAQELLDRYAINFIIIPGTDAITLRAYPLLLQLLGNDGWVLVYQDDVALILVRNSDINRSIITSNKIDKTAMTEHIQARWRWQSIGNY